MGAQLQMDVLVRWLIRRDFLQVMRIEHESFQYPWNESEFLEMLRHHNCIGMVAEHQEQILGFMIYELHAGVLGLLNFAVSPDCRRHGIGSQMIEKLMRKLEQQRRHAITTKVRESNLSAQLFFKSQGFLATEILHDEYSESPEDAYRFEYVLPEACSRCG